MTMQTGLELHRRIGSAHNPSLVTHVDAWNGIAQHHHWAEPKLRDRFVRELRSLWLNERYDIDAVATGSTSCTAGRALQGAHRNA